MANSIGFVATADRDTMFLYEAECKPHWPKLQTAMLEEVQTHKTNGHWELVDRMDIALACERRTSGRYALPCMGESKATHQGVNFIWETYALVVNWSST